MTRHGLAARVVTRWVQLAVTHARIMLVLSLLLALAATWTAITRLGVNTSTADMIGDEVAWRAAYVDFRAAFPQLQNNLLIVIDAADADQADLAAGQFAAAWSRQDPVTPLFAPQLHPFLQRNALLYASVDELQALALRLAEAQPFLGPLARDPTAAGLFGILAEVIERDKAADIEPLLHRVTEVIDSVAAGQPDALSWQDLMSGTAERPARRVLSATVQPGFAPAAAAVLSVSAARQQIATVEPVSVRLTGPVALEYEELTSVATSVVNSAWLALALVLVILLAGLRSVWLVFATLVSLVAGLAMTAAFAALAVGHLNLISVAFGVLYIGLGVDFSIHYCLRVREAIASGCDKTTALVTAAGDVGTSLLICALTTSLGFFAFFPTAFRGVSELGLISGVGMYISFAVTLTTLPALLQLLPLRFSGGLTGLGVLGKLSQRRLLWPLTIVLLLAGGLTLDATRFDSDPLNLRDPQAESVAAFRALLRDPDYAPRGLSLLVEPGEVEAMQLFLQSVPEVDSVRSIADLVPQQQPRKLAMLEELGWVLGDSLEPAVSRYDPERTRQAAVRLRTVAKAHPAASAAALGAALARLPDSGLQTVDAALAASLPYRLQTLAAALDAAPLTAEQLPGELRQLWITPDGRERLEIRPRPGLVTPPEQAQFVDAVRSIATQATGLAAVQTLAGRTVTEAFRQALLTAVAVIALLLLLLLRSIRETLMVLLPLAAASILTVAVMNLSGMAFNFANVIALPLLLGVGVDNGIHMVWRARHEQHDLLSTSTPRAIVTSALTTIASFGSLAVASHPGTASMGQVLAIGMLAMTMCTLLLIPSLLSGNRQ